MSFTRKIEDFVCEQCGASVAGDGYTNHCPQCLWSKHVDINPGDRAATCGGEMRPISVETKGGRQRIVHQCVRCSFIRRQEVNPNDSFEALLRVS